MENQLRDNCGIKLMRNPQDSNWFFGRNGSITGLVARDFELAAFAWGGAAGEEDHQIFHSQKIPDWSNAWSGQNYSGWRSPAADSAINALELTPYNLPERQTQLGNFQAAYTQDLVNLPLYAWPEYFGYDGKLTGFNVPAGTPTTEYGINAPDWEISGRTSLTIGIAGPVDSLFEIPDPLNGSQTVNAFTNSKSAFYQNYQPAAHLLTVIPSTVNGGLVVNAVTVNPGDRLVNANVEAATLMAGTRLRNADGNLVTYSIGTVQMHQLQATYTFIAGLAWNDGHPLTAHDFQLGYNAACSDELNPSMLCQYVGSINFVDTGYTITWLPGYAPLNYAMPPFAWYPAHQVITSGGTHNGAALADVPFEDWPDLPEVTHFPLSTGPYYVTENTADHITLTANPHFAGGAPKTATLILRYVNQETLDADLLSGVYDLVGPDTLGSISAELRAAVTAGTHHTWVNPAYTYEHLDMNQDLLFKFYVPLVLTR